MMRFLLGKAGFTFGSNIILIKKKIVSLVHFERIVFWSLT